VQAALGTQTDVLVVNEIENDGDGATSAIQDLTTKLNNATSPNTYAFINVDTATAEINALGIDAIKVGIVYKPAKVTPVGLRRISVNCAPVTDADSNGETCDARSIRAVVIRLS
jgi:uncharacterized protein